MDVALQSSVWVTSPEFSGWLIKRGFHWRKLWKKRWVALHGTEIVYMEKEPTVDTTDMVITKAQLTSATVIDREDIDGNPNGFAIHINDGHTPTWYLRAETLREKKSWLMRLGHVMTIVRWLEDFEKVRVLGVGGTGIVYELLHKTNGQRYAMKEMEIKNKSQMQMALSEAEMLKDIMENISHPSIMHIEKVFQVGSKFYLVFPLCTGGELYEHVIRRGHFSEHDAAVIMKDLISGLHALHQKDILHLDIKPENILFDSMDANARIKITDFGLSRLFSNGNNEIRTAPLPEEMAEKLKAFSESGVLNRDRLRGTVGYMSPELILCGYTSKATDVFAAGVVLYILLCGRPPFQSKSNREVLERTCKGLYRMDGQEWEGVSEEGKDLVRKMLIVDPEKRISTSDILAHPWMQLDAELEDDSEETTEPLKNTPERPSKQKSVGVKKLSAFGAKRSTNLNNALRLLSGHVNELKSEKLAMSFTRLVSSLDTSAQDGRHASVLSQLVIPVGKASKGFNKFEPTSEEGMMMFQNPDVKQALAAAIAAVGDDTGKLTLLQFMYILRYFIFNSGTTIAPALAEETGVAGSVVPGAENNLSQTPTRPSSGAGVVPMGLSLMLLCRFVDRDGDGMISADDIFTSQALVLQRSEVFLKVMFRIYCEAVWYPGRQINFMNLQQSFTKQQAGATNVLAEQKNVDVVEPPKFITARHVVAIFEKLGYDPSGGQKIFAALCEAVARRSREENGDGDPDERMSFNTSAALSGQAAPSSVASSAATVVPPPPPPATLTPKTPNAALAAAFGDDAFGVAPSAIVKPGAPTGRTRASSRTSAIDASAERPGNAAAAASDPVPLSGREGGFKSDGSLAKMDFHDFQKACELDDVLIQVLLRNLRTGLIGLIKRAETEAHAVDAENDGEPSSASVATTSTSSSTGTPPFSPAPSLSGAVRRPSSTVCERMTTSILENDLTLGLREVSLQKTREPRPAFPIANAVGRATLSAAMGLAAKVTGFQNLGSEDTPRSVSKDVKRSARIEEPDSDDEV